MRSYREALHPTLGQSSIQAHEDAQTDPEETEEPYSKGRRNVAYEVTCKDCSKTYIRETKRTLKVRLSEHNKLSR